LGYDPYNYGCISHLLVELQPQLVIVQTMQS
jgi:hypothetical protein